MAAFETVAPTAPPGDALAVPRPAPDLGGIAQWINSKPLSLKQLKGKVVMVDFWAYSCINCIRTVPHLEGWYQRYKNAGLVVIGIHAPEFPFEGKAANVAAAVRKFKITYPVALDNDYVTWNRYQNEYWPAHYLIDRQGNIVETHAGEGGYADTENHIRLALGMAKDDGMPESDRESTDDQTPETYLGLARADRYADAAARQPHGRYQFPAPLALHHWALSGQWQSQDDHIVADEAQASLRLHFQAGKAFLVLGSATGAPVSVHVHLEGGAHNASEDVHDEHLTVREHRLYQLARLDHPMDATLTLTADAPGLEAYAFTFGK
jgi:thiol-disulfide isomerase/thioredoxin